ncbi:MAG: hypothetical protein OEN23_09760 [Paracoccaceae bacterium]|nr:hypothetical protein [Paracoccaceae bacterium]
MTLFAPLVLALVLASETTIVGEIEALTDQERAHALAIHQAVEDTTEAITACTSDGTQLETCLCAKRDRLGAIRKALDNAFEAYPHWRGKSLIVYDTGDGNSLTLFLDTIENVSTAPDCE